MPISTDNTLATKWWNRDKPESEWTAQPPSEAVPPDATATPTVDTTTPAAASRNGRFMSRKSAGFHPDRGRWPHPNTGPETAQPAAAQGPPLEDTRRIGGIDLR